MNESRNLLEQIVDYAINLRYQDIPQTRLTWPR